MPCEIFLSLTDPRVSIIKLLANPNDYYLALCPLKNRVSDTPTH
ncbi:protein of unknown function [Streptococcus thermophilus]|nr:protein of unknown function [Streptococcus thermophilus]CAD0150342.1 protein of unknown function [Streptococcus thermophilus]